MRAAAWGVALALAAGPAWGQARGLEEAIARGLTLRQGGRDAEALAAFTELWERTHSPRVRAQMAMAEHALGRWAEADAHLREALATDDPWVERNRATLRAALPEIGRHVGRLEVRGLPAGAAVRVDGAPVGTLPLREPTRASEGVARLEVSAPGYLTAVRAVTIRGDAVAREEVTLTPDPNHRVAERVRVAGWVGVGVGGALLLGAAAALVLGGAAHDRGDREGAETLGTVAAAGFGAGVGLAALSTAVLIVARPRSARPSAWACGAGPGDVGVRCGGRF